jgi:hypothetical protein
MILRNRLSSPQAMISAGSFCLAAGLIAQRFIHPPSDFWQGFVAGLSGMLIGLSIVFNLRGLMLQRKLGS